MSILAWLSGRSTALLLVALGLTLAWGVRVDHLRADYKAETAALTTEINAALAAARVASKNRKLERKHLSQQILNLGTAVTDMKGAIAVQNAHIEAQVVETARLKQVAARLQQEAANAQAARQKVVTRLASLIDAPAIERTCEAALAKAEEALDLVYEGGL